MDNVHADGFVVYIRTDRNWRGHPDAAERPLATYASYEEARRVREHLRRYDARECVIRYQGDVGGGD